MASDRFVKKMVLISAYIAYMGTLAAVEGSKSHEPMVAFTCNLPAMHMTEHGWKRDDSTDCLNEPQQILDYCRRIYKELDIRNIVESGSYVRISDWCPVGRTHCHHHAFNVRPYRCLVGSFQSDALLVPRNCLFDHIHDPRTCQSFDTWNQSAVAACSGRGMEQHSFAIIQPCSIDRFSGAEFVCCPSLSVGPTLSASHTPTTKSPDTVKVNKSGKLKFVDLVTPPTKKPPSNHINRHTTQKDFRDLIGGKEDIGLDKEMDLEIEEKRGEDRVNGAFMRYMREGVVRSNSGEQNVSEHEAYHDAKLDLEKRHHHKITKMMREWNSAHQRVEEMMTVDSKGADKLNKQITARFQKMYDSLEEEEEAESKRLAALHHQRVQAELNELKRSAMESYMGALAESKPNSARILRALKHYVKLEQKDRVHMITHYQRTQQSDPVQADSIFSYVADHLTIIDQRIAQALDMLHSLPEYQQHKIRSHIDDFLSGFHTMDESLAVILAKMAERGNAVTNSTTTTPVVDTTRSITTLPATINHQDTPAISSVKSVKSSTSSAKTTGTPTAKTDRLPSGKIENLDRSFDRFDDGVMESRDDYIEIKPAIGHVNHFDNSQLDLVQMSALKIGGRTDTTGMYLATPLGIAVCSIALILIISVGIVVMKRKVGGVHPVNIDTGDLMCAPNPAGMEYRGNGRPSSLLPRQMNGYENPTHRFFDGQGQEKHVDEHSLERELEEAIEDEEIRQDDVQEERSG